METLPDYLTAGLDLVFVVLNPGLQSARTGHYFASPRNRFWRTANRAGIFDPPIWAEEDRRAVEQGIGFTDMAKRGSDGASDLHAADFKRWAPVLKARLERFSPRIVCFHSVVAYGNFLKYGLGDTESPGLGPQHREIGISKVFVTPNPSPANAVYSMDDLIVWHARLRAFREELARDR